MAVPLPVSSLSPSTEKVATAAARENRWFAWWLGWSVLGACLVIVGTGFFYVRRQWDNAGGQLARQLSVVADAKVAQIEQWRKERWGEATFMMGAPAVARDVAAYLAQPQADETRTDLLHWLTVIKGGERYASVAFFDADFRQRLVVPADTPEAGPLLHDRLLQARTIRNIVFSDLHRGSTQQVVHFDLVAPVFAPHAVIAQADPIGYVVFRIDPHYFLYPLLAEWPWSSRTGATLLLRKEGAATILLNEAREPGWTILPDGTTRPSLETVAVADPGFEGAVEGNDYRGVPVFALCRRVPQTGWVLIVKQDQVELYGPLHRQVWASSLVAGLSLVIVFLTAGLLWRQRMNRRLQDDLQREQERQVATERLALVMRHANDIFLLMDADWRIVEVNERAVEAYGYSRAELLSKTVMQLRSPTSLTGLDAQQGAVRTHGQVLFETEHVRKDGTVFPVEVSTRRIQLGDRTQIFSTIRDITERRRAEEALRQQARDLQARNAELERFNRAAVGREVRMVELKQEINALNQRLGQAQPYVLPAEAPSAKPPPSHESAS